MTKDGLQRTLDLLDRLESAGIHFQIDHVRPDALLVFFTLVGARVEVDCFVDRLAYRCFKGGEDVHVDEEKLMTLVRA